MRRLLFFVALLFGATASPAADEPLYAPAPDWVEPLAIPAPSGVVPAAPVQTLLLDTQTRFDPAGDVYYVETAAKIVNAQGLSGAGTIALPWHPDTRTLTIHKVHILRGGERIDVLGAGQKFISIRREGNLEMAMLDGVLTAVLQPEGLEVGDIVNLAFSYRNVPKSISFKAETFGQLPPGLAVGSYRSRHLWPRAMPIEWRATGLARSAKLRDRGAHRELSLQLSNVSVPPPPANAPQRYAFATTVQTSAYRSWEEAGAILAPAYREAAIIAPVSPLRAELAKIAAAHPGAAGRALASLRLVQDRVRYVAIGMNEGGYLPAQADETWARRYGDCKAKTALLIALLRELGISAEPVLASVGADGLIGQLLPSTDVFDHVLVKASVDGETLWLDGTMAGQRSTEELRESRFRHVLPIAERGATLQQPPLVPATQPLVHWTLKLDASAGIDLPAPTRVEYRWRGRDALDYSTWVAGRSSSEAEKAVRDWAEKFVPTLEIEGASHRFDDATSTMIFSVNGKSQMFWRDNPERTARRMLLKSDTAIWEVEFEREAKDEDGLPFSIPYPLFETSEVTVLLPLDGKGFSLVGEDIEETVGGAQISRKTTLSGNRLTLVSSFRTTATEIAADVAKAALPRIKRINGSRAYVQAPAAYTATKQEVKAALENEPKTVDAYVTRGNVQLDRGLTDKALGDFEQAVRLDPASAYAVANRGIARFWKGDIAGAEGDFDRANTLDAGNPIAFNGRGLVLTLRGRLPEAIAALSRAIDAKPNNLFALTRRAVLKARTDDHSGALADLSQALTLSPDDPGLLSTRAEIHAAAGEKASALADIDRLIARDETGFSYQSFKASLLKRMGDEAAAGLAFDKALAGVQAAAAKSPDDRSLDIARASILDDRGERAAALAVLDRLIAKDRYSKSALNTRCWLRVMANEQLDKALADCNAAIAEDDGFAPALDSRAWVRLLTGRAKEAIADFDRALAIEPSIAASLYGRGIAKRRLGDEAGAIADIMAARAFAWRIDEELETLTTSANGDGEGAAGRP